MYPWEHAAVAYLLYAGYTRRRDGAPPAGWAVLVVLFASQLPDLIDKPLAWQFGLLPSGRSPAHSMFVAVPLSVVALVFARRHDKTSLGVAFAVGLLSHLVTDAVALYPGGSTSFESVLWPLVTYESSSDATSASDGGVLGQTTDTMLGAYPSLIALEPTLDVVVRIGFVVLAVGLWLYDGRPGIRELGSGIRWPLAAVRTLSRRS